MAKRKQSGLDTVASMPWPLGIVLGLIGYITIRHGVGWYFDSLNNPFTAGLGKLAGAGIYEPLGWLLLIGCWIAALASFIGRRRRRRLFDSQTGADSLRQMNWRQFEQLAGEAFRRQGYAVEETGLGGADGGIDLILRVNGQTTLVQCKQWQNRHVGVKIVREMYGLLLHHQAASVKIVALGDYTSDARHFAQGKPIELIHGGALLATVRSLQTPKTGATEPMNSPLSLTGSMLACLLVIGALQSPITTAPVQAIAPSISFAPPVRRLLTHARNTAVPPTPHPQAEINFSDSRNDAQLRDWKKRNAESMKILEKTTKELPRR